MLCTQGVLIAWLLLTIEVIKKLKSKCQKNT